MSILLPSDMAPLACRFSATTDLATGIARVEILVPGTPGTETRRIAQAQGWFGTHVSGDSYKSWIEDVNNIMGQGAGFIPPLGKFYDDAVAADNQGWFFPPGIVTEIGGIGRPKVLVAGLYLVIEAQKAGALPLGAADTLYCNLFWGGI